MAKDVVDAEVVIVGGGIAGLATALALRRAGAAACGVLVLERHAGLRATGAALTIFPNGWFALRALGVAHKLASRYDAYETCVRRAPSSSQTQFELDSPCLLSTYMRNRMAVRADPR